MPAEAEQRTPTVKAKPLRGVSFGASLDSRNPVRRYSAWGHGDLARIFEIKKQ